MNETTRALLLRLALAEKARIGLHIQEAQTMGGVHRDDKERLAYWRKRLSFFVHDREEVDAAIAVLEEPPK